MAPLTNNHKILIKIFHLEKGYSAVQMMCEFPARNLVSSNFVILLNTSTWQATLTGERVADDCDLLELLQKFNLSVIHMQLSTEFCKFWHITHYSVPQEKKINNYALFCPTRKTN